MRRLALLVGLVLLLLLARGPALQAQGSLSGEASWSQEVKEMVQEWALEEHGATIALDPGPFPHLNNRNFDNADMLAELNTEFAHRFNMLMALWQAQAPGVTLGIRPRDGGLRTPALQRDIFLQGRRLVGTDPNDPAHYRIVGPTVTNAINVENTWHGLGLAVDVGYFRNGTTYVGGSSAEAQTHFTQPAWAQMQDMALALGLYPGSAFGDTPHFEYHPGYGPRGTDVRQFVAETGATLGQAATTVNPGYRFRCPSAIYYALIDDQRHETVEVSELARDGNWICLKRFRHINRLPDGRWDGTWVEFDPPVRYFPAYLPVDSYGRTRDDPPMTSRFTLEAYVEHGRPGPRFHLKQSGTATIEPNLMIEDLMKMANRQRASTGSFAPYEEFANLSVYSLNTSLWVQETPFPTRARAVDDQGYTVDVDESRPIRMNSFALILAWNRQWGSVAYLAQGPGGEWTATGNRMTQVDGSSHEVHWAAVPAGFQDHPEPPPWTAPNPHPSPSPLPESPPPADSPGFLQP